MNEWHHVIVTTNWRKLLHTDLTAHLLHETASECDMDLAPFLAAYYDGLLADGQAYMPAIYLDFDTIADAIQAEAEEAVTV